MKKHVNSNLFGKLQDFIPVCARCKTVRKEEGFWVQVVGTCHPKFAEMEFAYCICAKCAQTLYPDEYNRSV